ncbi:MAG: ribosomal L7Ae/L30e/S12e/Gadd45 family protein [Thermaerobacter sp.]|nr:ribosomal L7Ae/L30e/S12e/Gadd45 family protein [Thermaerobacter sp.]
MDANALRDPRQRVVGRRETLKHVARGNASRVYIARDAEARIAAELAQQCADRKIPVEYVDTMTQLGQMCGIDVGAACAAAVPRRI